MSKRFLLMYITQNSGHHRACLALESAMRQVNGTVYTSSINSFNYTNPILEKIINRTYLTVIKRKPEFWEYLYDNPVVVEKSRKLKESIHRFNSGKMKSLIDNFRPDAVICTQAFPCGMIADLKKTYNLKLPLYAVLTDYAPHSYWVYNEVDTYIVPAPETGTRLVENGVSEAKIKPLGIPVHPRFYQKHDKAAIREKYSLDKNKPVVLLMGGGLGLGPIAKLTHLMDKSHLDIQALAVTGSNRKAFRHLKRRERHFKKKIHVFSFIDNIDELMEAADLIITKPGGLTTAEAMAKRLPMVIINPLPGQEKMNTEFFMKKKIAVKAKDEREALVLIEELLGNIQKLENIKSLMDECAPPETSIRTARLVMEKL